MSRRKSSNSSYIPGGPSPFWAAQGLPPEGVRKKKRKPGSDLQTIKTMLRRARVGFQVDKNFTDKTGLYDINGPQLGWRLTVDYGLRHTVEMVFDMKSKLVDVEGGGY